MSHSFFEAFTKSKAKAFMPKSLNLINLDGDDSVSFSASNLFLLLKTKMKTRPPLKTSI